jgi:GNAT superfamily N-acetyltransferase
MHALAELIDLAFAGELDASARQMVAEMRAFGRAGWLGWLVGKLFLPQSAYPKGFVWEADGHLVGNASLMEVEHFQGRWVMANVAVHPSYRRRGIARSLIGACLDWLKTGGARVVILQAKSAQRGLQVLYASLGFRPTTTRTAWERYPGPVHLPPPTPQVRPRHKDEWQAHWELARRVHPEGLLWPYPPTASLFREPGMSWPMQEPGARHWLWVEAGRPLAGLSVRPRLDRIGWRLLLACDPALRGVAEGPLLAQAFRDLPIERSPVTLDYPSGYAEQTLSGLGFHPARQLTWMECRLSES